MTRFDETIRKRIVDQLTWDERVDAAAIDVAVENGRVTLSGTVPNYTALLAASNDVQAVPGVQKVVNELTVLYPTTAPLPDDGELRARLESLLRWNALIDEDSIQVQVDKGVIRLRGAVDAYWKKEKVRVMALELCGVVDVVNDLAVVPTNDTADAAIAEEIEAAFERNAVVDAEAVEVRVENGEVVLGGTVPNWAAFRAVYDTALYTPGVRNVLNGMTILVK